MEDMVLRDLEILAKERKEDVSTIIAKAVKICIKKINRVSRLVNKLKSIIDTD